MKKILGLDVGVASIGWAVVHEAENESEKSSIKEWDHELFRYLPMKMMSSQKEMLSQKMQTGL